MSADQYTMIQGSCNFETQGRDWMIVCGFTQDLDNQFDWHIGNNVVIENGGPANDHTPGNILLFSGTVNK